MKNTNEKFLFWASFLTLIAAGMGFAIRGDILADWGRQFGFTQTELGEITGWGLAGFGVTIIFFSFFADLVGYGPLMIIAFLLHILTVALTLAAPYAFSYFGATNPAEGKLWAFRCLFYGQLSFSLANGTCEAVINPLTASLFPNNKTHWLNILHAGWPGGLVLGAAVEWVFAQAGVTSWEVRWAIILAPMLLYGLMMVGRRFPHSEAKLSGVSVATMAKTLLAPLLLFLFLIHAMIGYVELGTDSWIQDITKIVLNKNTALLAFAWTNILMFTLRFFAGPIVHKINPVGLLFFSAILGTTGLVLLGMPMTNTMWLWLAAVTVYGIGKTFYWPTMLGVISERFPQGGALALGFSGGIGMISAGLLGGPLIGYNQDYAATTELQQQVAKSHQEPPTTYDRYKSDEPRAPLPVLPKIYGLDNAKVGVLNDTPPARELNEDLERSPGNEKLRELKNWWLTQGEPHEDIDRPLVNQARLFGGKTALWWTAAVPAIMAVCYLIILVYFRLRGGYKAEVLAAGGPGGEGYPEAGGPFRPHGDKVTGGREDVQAPGEKYLGGTEGPGEG
jgi:MFS family permease